MDPSPVILDDSLRLESPPLEHQRDGDDAFFARLSTLLPSDVARSFNDAQLVAIAYGGAGAIIRRTRAG